jgi:energy-coupling factor transport system permease protein
VWVAIVKTTIAQYYPGRSAVHRIDPRVKVVAVAVLAVALFVRDSFAALAVYTALAIVGLAVSRVPLVWVWRSLRPLLWLIVLTFALQVFFAPGAYLFHYSFLHVSRPGLEQAFYLSLRLIVLVVIGSLLTFTTPAIALTDALAWLGRPLRRLRVPTEELALMTTIALRFIPTLVQEADVIMRAQRARGADFSHGGPITRARALLPVLIPLFIVSFRRADDLALAMEARCYMPGVVRTRLHPMQARPRDALVLLIVVSAVVLALVVG